MMRLMMIDCHSSVMSGNWRIKIGTIRPIGSGSGWKEIRTGCASTDRCGQSRTGSRHWTSILQESGSSSRTGSCCGCGGRGGCCRTILAGRCDRDKRKFGRCVIWVGSRMMHEQITPVSTRFVVYTSGLCSLGQPLKIKLVGISFSVHFAHDVFVVVVAEGSTQLVVVHVRLALTLTPPACHLVRVAQFKFSVLTLPRNERIVVVIGQQFEKKLPQLNLAGTFAKKNQRLD